MINVTSWQLDAIIILKIMAGIMTPLVPLSTDTVLIVDDEPLVSDLCGRILKESGFRPVTCNHPRQALAALEQTTFDLLIVDLLLPEIGGFQLLEIARTRQPEIAVLIITSQSDLKIALEALQRAADGLRQG